MTDALHGFFFDDPASFMIPVEHLSPAGIAPEFAQGLIANQGLTQGWVDLFNQAFALFSSRVADLFQRSPGHWFPARVSNVVIVTDPDATHPYLRPLSKSAWILYASDFEPETSSLELATYLLVHAERLNITGDVAQTIAKNLSYWIDPKAVDYDDFRAGAARCVRPDAAAYKGLANALEWTHQLHHMDLRPPSELELPEASGLMRDTGLILAASLASGISTLADRFDATAQETIHAYYRRQAPEGPDPADELMAWLAADAPWVLLVDSEDEILWDPDAPAETAKLRKHMGDLGEAPAAALRKDLELISARSRAFVDSVHDPDSLPLPTEDIDQEGGTYIHTQRRMIAFNVERQASWVPMREATPPYQRLLLAARTVHEWGHLADESGLIAIPPENQEADSAARAELAAAFEKVVQGAPPPVKAWAEENLLKNLEAEGQGCGEALAENALRRLPDFAANRLMGHFLEPAELESYLRVNVRTHAEEAIDPFMLLARHAVEFQYLRLSPLADPMSYFLEMTGVDTVLIQGGLLSREDIEAILDATWKVCECYVIAKDRFKAFPE